MAQKRTTLRSRTGTKLYAKGSTTGQFTDIQTYKRAHGRDIKRRAKAETSRRTAAARGRTSRTSGGEE
jgi:hypothetical protein